MIAYVQPGLAAVLGVAYLATGGAVAWSLYRKDPSPAVVAGALVAWPVFLPLLGAPPARPRLGGPLQGRIHEVFGALERTLADPVAAGVPWDADVGGLRDALLASDARLGLADRLLAETGGDAGLREARERAACAIGGVLDEVVQLRLQIGLAALHGDEGAIRAHLAALLARVRALDEVTRIHG
ncbi:MAG: hypothetical protein KC656_04430 [Myxococcales bacterium]|nr:hypothetical protein [Myxococcales bacterium]